MRVLILSVTAGGGHNSTAQAIETCLHENGAECHVLDTLKYINTFLNFTIAEGYLFVTQHMKQLYGHGYRMAESRKSTGDGNSMTRRNWSLVAGRLKQYLNEYDPDVVVYTHIFAGIMLDILRQKNELTAKTVGILTDYAFHPYWEEAKHLDHIVIPDESLIYQAQRKGYRRDQLLAYGIPVNPKFALRQDKREMRERHGLDPDRATVLFMGGSMGYGNMAEIVRRLDDLEADFQLIVVCGSNRKAFDDLTGNLLTFRKKVLPLGFVNYVDELMDASDLLITKPGGLSTSEALCKELPMILVNPIPGQEDRNTEFFLNHGAAVSVSHYYSLEEALWVLLHSPERQENMRQAIRLLRHPDAVNRICQFVLSEARERE